MRKDYAADTGSKSDMDFAEGFWTQIWDDKGIAEKDLSDTEEWRVISPFIGRMPKNAKILDAGCGSGEWTVWLKRRGYDVTGVDISKKTIGQLRGAYPDIDFRAGDVTRLEFPDETFDAIISWGVFEHFEDGLSRPVREAWRALRKGGSLMISVPYNNIRHVLRDLRALEKWDDAFRKSGGYRAPTRFYQWRLGREELRRELLRGGFDDILIAPIYSMDGMSRFLEGDLGLGERSIMRRGIMKTLDVLGFAPKFLSHMILAVAVKK